MCWLGRRNIFSNFHGITRSITNRMGKKKTSLLAGSFSYALNIQPVDISRRIHEDPRSTNVIVLGVVGRNPTAYMATTPTTWVLSLAP